jgi:hypothetical protein
LGRDARTWREVLRELTALGGSRKAGSSLAKDVLKELGAAKGGIGAGVASLTALAATQGDSIKAAINEFLTEVDNEVAAERISSKLEERLERRDQLAGASDFSGPLPPRRADEKRRERVAAVSWTVKARTPAASGPPPFPTRTTCLAAQPLLCDAAACSVLDQPRLTFTPMRRKVQKNSKPRSARPRPGSRRRRSRPR